MNQEISRFYTNLAWFALTNCCTRTTRGMMMRTCAVRGWNRMWRVWSWGSRCGIQRGNLRWRRGWRINSRVTSGGRWRWTRRKPCIIPDQQSFPCNHKPEISSHHTHKREAKLRGKQNREKSRKKREEEGNKKGETINNIHSQSRRPSDE